MPKPLIPVTAGVILAVGFLLLFFGGGTRFAIGLTLKPMVEEFGWGRSEIGIAVAVYMVVTAFFTFWAGRVADRVNLRALMISGILVSTFGIGMMTFVSMAWHVLVLYGVVLAVGNGMVSTTSIGVMVTRAHPDRPGMANAVATSGVSAGQLVMIAILAVVLVSIGWRSVFVWLGIAHLLLVPILYLVLPDMRGAGRALSSQPAEGMSLGQAAATRQFWLLLIIYAICGFDDFFVSTHVVAFAQDKGVDTYLAGNLLAVMGLTALIGVIVAGIYADRTGPVFVTVISFAARVVVFVLIAFDQSLISIAIFALVFGATFMVTAPITVLFVRDAFGVRNLGAITGMVTMVHQIFGGIGAYVGSLIFDATGRYDVAFITMLVGTVVALVLTLMLARKPAKRGRA